MRPEEVDSWYELLKDNGCTGIIDYGEWIMLKCVFHDQSDSKRPSFGIHKETGTGNCFGCGRHSWEEICELFGLETEEFIDGVKEKTWEFFRRKLFNRSNITKFNRYKIPELVDQTNSRFLKYIEGRGIDGRLLKRFDITYCIDKKSKYYQHIIIPIVDEKGVLYFQGRYIGDKDWLPRWRQPKDCARWKTYWGWEEFKNKESVFFVEGVTDALNMVRLGFPTITAKNFSPYQISMILKSGIKNIFLCYDNDPAGRTLQNKRGWDIHFTAKAKWLFQDSGRMIYDAKLPSYANDPGELKSASDLIEVNSVIREYVDTF